MRKAEAFSGVRVLTYAVMSNHFHLLVEVPERARWAKRNCCERMTVSSTGLLMSRQDEAVGRMAQERGPVILLTGTG